MLRTLFLHQCFSKKIDFHGLCIKTRILERRTECRECGDEGILYSGVCRQTFRETFFKYSSCSELVFFFKNETIWILFLSVNQRFFKFRYRFKTIYLNFWCLKGTYCCVFYMLSNLIFFFEIPVNPCTQMVIRFFKKLKLEI